MSGLPHALVVKGGKMVYQDNSVVYPPPAGAVPLGSIPLVDYTPEAYGVQYEDAGNYMACFLIDVERAVGKDAMRSGLQYMLSNGVLNGVFINGRVVRANEMDSNADYYKKLRTGVSMGLPAGEKDDKLAQFDNLFRTRFFGEEHYKKLIDK